MYKTKWSMSIKINHIHNLLSVACVTQSPVSCKMEHHGKSWYSGFHFQFLPKTVQGGFSCEVKLNFRNKYWVKSMRYSENAQTRSVSSASSWGPERRSRSWWWTPTSCRRTPASPPAGSLPSWPPSKVQIWIYFVWQGFKSMLLRKWR